MGTTLTQVTPVNGSVYTVTVSGITGNGALGLNLVDNGTIHDLAGNPLTQQNGPTSLESQQTFATGSAPYSVATGDVNGDGTPDLVIANYFGNSVSVLLGNGNGTFQAQQTFATGPGPASVVVADVNGDGLPDLVVADRGSNTVSLLLGNGNGTFQAQQTFATGPGPSSVVVGDVNGDGIGPRRRQLWSDTVSVLLGMAMAPSRPSRPSPPAPVHVLSRWPI